MKEKTGKRRIWPRVIVAMVMATAFFGLGLYGMQEGIGWVCWVAVAGLMLMAVYILMLVKSKPIVRSGDAGYSS